MTVRFGKEVTNKKTKEQRYMKQELMQVDLIQLNQHVKK